MSTTIVATAATRCDTNRTHIRMPPPSRRTKSRNTSDLLMTSTTRTHRRSPFDNAHGFADWLSLSMPVLLVFVACAVHGFASYLPNYLIYLPTSPELCHVTTLHGAVELRNETGCSPLLASAASIEAGVLDPAVRRRAEAREARGSCVTSCGVVLRRPALVSPCSSTCGDMERGRWAVHASRTCSSGHSRVTAFRGSSAIARLFCRSS